MMDPSSSWGCWDDNKRGIIFSIMARDGSGPLRTSFLTMLLLEDTIATAHEPFGVCFGEAGQSAV